MNKKKPANRYARIAFNIVFAYFFVAIGVYVAVALFVTLGTVRSGHAPAELPLMILVILSSVAMIAFSAGMALPFVVLKETSLRKAGSNTMAMVLIFGVSIASFILLDIAALMGLVGTFFTMNRAYVFPTAGIAAAGMIAARSRCGKCFAEFERIYPPASGKSP